MKRENNCAPAQADAVTDCSLHFFEIHNKMCDDSR